MDEKQIKVVDEKQIGYIKNEIKRLVNLWLREASNYSSKEPVLGLQIYWSACETFSQHVKNIVTNAGGTVSRNLLQTE